MTPNQSGIRYLGTRRMAVVSAGILVLVLYGLAGELLRSRAMNAELEKLTAQAKVLEAGNKDATQRLASSSSVAALEREARLKMNLRRPGEEVVVVRVSGSSESPDEEGQAATKKSSNPAKWWYHFFR